jgi:hypothetical protein
MPIYIAVRNKCTRSFATANQNGLQSPQKHAILWLKGKNFQLQLVPGWQLELGNAPKPNVNPEGFLARAKIVARPKD